MKANHRILTVLAIGALVAAPLQPAEAGALLSSTNHEITDAAVGDAWVGEADVTSHGNSLYVVWRDGRRTDGAAEADIAFASSTDGVTWSPNKLVSDPDFVGFTNHPAISAAPNGTLWVTWGLSTCTPVNGPTCGGTSDIDNDIRAAVSADGGQTWVEDLVWDGTDGPDRIALRQRPQVHADNDRTFVLLHDPTVNNGSLIGFDVILTVNTLSGSTINTTWKFLTTPGNSSGRLNEDEGSRLALAVRGNTICAAWEDQRDANAIYGTCSTDRGATFGPSARWSTSGNAWVPRLAFAPDGRLVLSYKNAPDKDVVVRVSNDAGSTWGEARQATNVGARFTYDYDLTVGPDGQLIMPVVIGPLVTIEKTDLTLVTSIDGGQTFALNGPVEMGTERFFDISGQLSVAAATWGPSTDARATFVFVDTRGRGDSAANRLWSAPARLDAIPPTPPGSVQAMGGDTSVLVQWTASSDSNGVASYNVLRSATAGGPYTQLNPRAVTQTFYRDVGLPAGTYYYRVTAVDGTGNASAPSAEVMGSASSGGPVSGISGVLAYDIPGRGLGLRPLTNGVPGAETVTAGIVFPNYSPDGQRLYYAGNASGTRGTVYVADRNGANPRPVLNETDEVLDLDVASDGNYVAANFQEDFNGVCNPLEARLLQVGPSTIVARTTDTNVESVSVSPDRRWLAYTNDLLCGPLGTVRYDSHRLCLIDTLAVSPPPLCQPPAFYAGVDFDSSGGRLVFSARFGAQNEIWRASIGPDGALSNYVQLTSGPVGQPSLYPRFSSDGNWVVFLRDIDAGSGQNLQAHVVRADGDSLRTLGFAATSIAWSGGGPSGPTPGLTQRVLLPSIRR